MKDTIHSPEMYRRDRILDHWLEQMETGQATMEECLAQHPELRHEMEPALRTARQLFAGDVTPLSAAQVQAIRLRVFARVPPATRRSAPPRGLRLPPVWARLAGTVAVLLLVLGMGIVGAWTVSADSLPGSPLYPVKRGAETLQLAFTTNPADIAHLHLTFALRRVDEGLRLKQPERTMNDTAEELQRTEVALDRAEQVGAPIDWEYVAGLSERGERELVGLGLTTPEIGRAAEVFRGLQQRAQRQLRTSRATEETTVPVPSADPAASTPEAGGSAPAPTAVHATPMESDGAPEDKGQPGGAWQGGADHLRPSETRGASISTETSPPKATPGATADLDTTAAPQKPATRATPSRTKPALATPTSVPTAVPSIAPTSKPAVAPGQGQDNGPGSEGNSAGSEQGTGGDSGGSSGGGSSGSGGGGGGGSSSSGGGGGSSGSGDGGGSSGSGGGGGHGGGKR